MVWDKPPLRHEAHMKKLAEDEDRLMDEFYTDQLTPSDLSRAIDPEHYNNNDIEPIAYIMANGLDFCEGNVVKYVTRWRQKGGVTDLHKAKEYLDFLIKNEEEGTPLR